MKSKSKRFPIKLSAIMIISMIVMSCNDNGTENGKPSIITSLSLPTEISVAPGNSNQTSLLKAADFVSQMITRGTITDPNTDFSTDKASVYSNDAAKNEVITVNLLLCLVDKFQFAEKLNLGPYNIVIDYFDCIEKYYPDLVNKVNKSLFIIEGTVNSTRKDDNSTQNIST